jgi:hypothetical protein
MERQPLTYPDDFPLFSGMDAHGPLDEYAQVLRQAIEAETESLLDLVDTCEAQEAVGLMLQAQEALAALRAFLEAQTQQTGAKP